VKLASLELDDAEAEEESSEKPRMPKYPWGTSLSLDKWAQEQVGLEGEEPPVGATIAFEGVAKVTGINKSETHDGKEHSCLTLQIIKLGFEDKPKEAKTLYEDE